MAYNDQSDLEDRMGADTIMAIYETGGNGEVNTKALNSVLNAAFAEVNSFFVRNYPKLLPVAADTDGTFPQTLKNAEFAFFYVFSRDRKSEYWNNSRDNERRDRIKEAYAMLERYAEGKQQLYDTPEPKPDTVGGVVLNDGIQISTDGDGF